MKILVDMNLSPDWVEVFARHGLEVGTEGMDYVMNLTGETTMKQNRIRRVLLSLLGCAVMLAAVGLLGVKAGGQSTTDDKDSKAALPVEQVIASIRTAVAAKPGDVLAVEAEVEDGKILCEVEILAQDRKIYEVEVDVATNTVVEIEEDND